MNRIIFAVVIGLGFSGTARAQQDPPAPCGPSGQLGAEVSGNVAADSRCFELRMYTVNTERDGKVDELHQRFREGEIALFEKHGAEAIAAWQSLDNANTLVWMLAYRDRAHREEVWAAFFADPAWTALREKYPAPIERPNVTMMSATDYSPLK
jgi:hypothetical protein